MKRPLHALCNATKKRCEDCDRWYNNVMTKIIQAFLSGVFFTFILDFFLFLGIKLNYIDPLGIEVYYNILFWDHQNIYLFLVLSALLGYIVMFLPNKVRLPVMTALFALVFATLYPPIGKAVAEAMLMRKDVVLHNDKFAFYGDIYYIGRNKITFYDKDLKKVILLDKNEILEKEAIE